MKRILLEHARSTDRLARSVFTSKGKVLLTAGQKLESRFVSRLKELGISHVYVEDDESQDIAVEDIVSEQLRLEMTQALRSSIARMKHKKATLEVGHLMSLLDEVIDEITQQKSLLVSFMDIRSAEDYLYAHSVNTCLLSIAVGQRFFQDKRRLKDLAVGALLHDAGMAHVPEKIVQKKARLTPPERKIVQAHTEEGYKMMKSKYEVSLLSAHIAYQHHERYDSSGYPRGLSGDMIHPFAKIVAVCSVYDALTSDRPYRRHFLPDRAFSVLLAESKKAFDPDVVRAFAECVAIYPVGTIVRLSNGMEGIVTEVKKGLSHRPKVRITKESSGKKVESLLELDLLQERTLFVEEILE